MDIDALRNEDGTWKFHSFKASDTESEITAFSETGADERGLKGDLPNERDENVEDEDEDNGSETSEV